MGEPVRVEASADPDPIDFADLMGRHQAMVFSIAFHFVRDRSVAEDLAQDVFLQLFRELPSLSSPDHVTFWLRKVTSHRCIDYARRRRWSTVSLDDAPELHAVNLTSDPILARRLGQLVGALPPTPRMVVILRYQEDLMPAEIAQVLAMPIGTVKSHLHRSLGMLRDKIKQVMGDVTV